MIKLAAQSIDETSLDEEVTEQGAAGPLLGVVSEDDLAHDTDSSDDTGFEVDEEEDDDEDSSDTKEIDPATDDNPDCQIAGEPEVANDAIAEASAEQLPATIEAAKLPEKIMQVPDSLRERDLRLIEAHQNDIREHRSTVRNRFLEWSEAKKEAKAAKDAYDLAVTDLLNVIDEGPQRQHSLFPTTPAAGHPKAEAVDVKVEQSEPSTTNNESSATVATAAPPVYEFKGWRDTTIGEFCHGDVSPGLAEILVDMKMRTVGQLADFLAGDRVSIYLTPEEADSLRAEIEVCKQTAEKPKAQPPADDDRWRGISIDDLDLPKTLRDKLRDADILDVGGIADWTSSGKMLTDIKGVGEKKAELIQDALEKVWASRQDDQETEPEADDEEEAEDEDDDI